MALIKCYECGREISSAASSCPHCGAPVIPPKAIESKNTERIVKKMICTGCGKTFEGNEIPDKCPICKCDSSFFKEVTPSGEETTPSATGEEPKSGSISATALLTIIVSGIIFAIIIIVSLHTPMSKDAREKQILKEYEAAYHSGDGARFERAKTAVLDYGMENYSPENKAELTRMLQSFYPDEFSRISIKQAIDSGRLRYGMSVAEVKKLIGSPRSEQYDSRQNIRKLYYEYGSTDYQLVFYGDSYHHYNSY